MDDNFELQSIKVILVSNMLSLSSWKLQILKALEMSQTPRVSVCQNYSRGV